MNAFDIETGPQPDSQLAEMMEPWDPEKEIPDPGPFDPNNRDHFKAGQTKDPAKLEVKIAEARAKHESERKDIKKRRAQAGEARMAKFRDEAALSPLTGCTLAIGYFVEDKGFRVSFVDANLIGDRAASQWVEPKAVFAEKFQAALVCRDEFELIHDFWNFISHSVKERASTCGHFIHGYDLPFLLNRSRILGVDVPKGIVEFRGKWPNWNPLLIDTHPLWTFGNNAKGFGLGNVSKACGGPGKPPGEDGGDFHRNFNAGTEEGRRKAFSYLFNDMEMSVLVALKAGII